MERSGPYWLQLVWTGLFAAGLALVFTLLGFMAFARSPADWLDGSRWSFWFSRNLMGTLIIAYLIHALFEGAGWLVGGPERIRGFSARQRTALFAGIPLLGVALGWPFSVWLLHTQGIRLLSGPTGFRFVAFSVGLSLLTCFVLYHWFNTKARALEAERWATQAQLRLLQAQIEPHFLFNTLANVHSLIDHDTAQAKATLGAFTDYLRCSLASLRREQVPLADELALAQAYLRVQAARMEDRLRFSIETEIVTQGLLVPPLLLQPLVENAVVHGIEPSLQGGEVRIRALLQDGSLLLEVHDDGAPDPSGRTANMGAGMAIDNIQARLQARFGPRAGLELRRALPPTGTGTVARLWLPAMTTAAS